MRILSYKKLLITGFLALVAMAVRASPVLDERGLSSELVPGGIYIGHAEPGTQIFYEGEAVRVSKQGWFILGFGRNAELVQHYQQVLPGKPPEEVELKLQPREYKIQRINGVAKKYIQPAKAVLARIQLENGLVKEARTLDSGYTDFFEGFSWPLTGPVTGVYGSQRYFNGKPRRPHYGVDVAAPVGTPVVAPADGVVTLAESDLYFSGGTVIMDHGFGLSSSFLHLSRVSVARGQVVKRGDTIGLVGATGRVTGAHLDWRINWFDKRLDPQLLAGAQNR
ncbi:M23 family metallopeptidase [Endozoicomonas sp. Mp262]|uniref:M23 family metallopeptidase n=1 Tax=Endozoicomonas sp. Mp262 TaxID=2919499 RepID=UPI0021D9EE1B